MFFVINVLLKRFLFFKCLPCSWRRAVGTEPNIRDHYDVGLSALECGLVKILPSCVTNYTAAGSVQENAIFLVFILSNYVADGGFSSFRKSLIS